MKKETYITFSFLVWSAPFLFGQNEGAEKVKLPVQAAIVRNQALPPEDEIGNVVVTYSDGTTDTWTLKGNCAEPKVSPRGVVGWEVYKLEANAKTLSRYNGLYINSTVVLCDHGKVIANLASAKSFIEGWDFTKDGQHVVIKSRGAHGPATIELFSTRSGPPEASVQAYDKNLPEWATAYADAD